MKDASVERNETLFVDDCAEAVERALAENIPAVLCGVADVARAVSLSNHNLESLYRVAMANAGADSCVNEKGTQNEA